MTKCQNDPTCCIFLKRGLSKDFKSYISMCKMHKYKNKIKIHKYSIWRSARKTQHVVYFWKEDSVNHPRIICVSSVHRQCIISASSGHHCSVFITQLSPVYCCLVPPISQVLQEKGPKQLQLDCNQIDCLVHLKQESPWEGRGVHHCLFWFHSILTR